MTFVDKSPGHAPERHHGSNSVTPKAKKHLCWIPHVGKGFVLANVVSIDGDQAVVRSTSDGSNQDTKLKRSQLKDVNPENLDRVPDNCMLMFLNEATLLHNLKVRYEHDEIYTYTAYILLAVNPYKTLSIYDDERMELYRNRPIGVLPPHVFAVTDRAYRLMKQEGHSQSVIISGESGAGKTETSKIVMRYLAHVGRASAKGELGQRVMESNPVLEAFGNAKTLRNNNSSRFGKFIKINFSKEGVVVGAAISTYLLERSRLVHQDHGERNYHIFYQLCAGASPQEKQALKLGVAEDFHFLTEGKCTKIVGVDDAEDFRRVRSAMDQIGLTAEEQGNIFRVLAGLLHLGNISFSAGDKNDGAQVSNTQALQTAAELFGVGVQDLEKTLLFRTMEAKTRVREVYMIPLKLSEAMNSRNALAKAVYQKLFDTLVKRINDSLRTVVVPYAYIGVLDIFGFEFFEHNSFEQFCINYANEKLQQYFNQQIFKQEEELYLREGIKWQHVPYQDNSDTIDMIEKRPMGILSILEEQIKLPNSTDRTFTMKVHEMFKTHPKFLEPRLCRAKGVSPGAVLSKEEGFVIRHFAGDVIYDSTGFLEKNNDTIHADLMNLLNASEDNFISGTLFADAAVGNNANLPRTQTMNQRFSSVGGKFALQLGELMRDICATSSHFIRCVKPNVEQRPGIYQGSVVLAQIIASGMHEALRLLHSGFPTRCPFEALYTRYGPHMPKQLSSLPAPAFCEALLMALEFSRHDFQIGLTRVFFKAGKLAFLDELTGSASDLAPEIANKVRRWLVKKRLRRAMLTIVAARKFVRLLYELRLLRRLQHTVRLVVVCNKTFLRSFKKIRIRRAARCLQAVWKMYGLRRVFVRMRKRATIIQAVWRGMVIFRLNKDKIAELKRLRLEREREEKIRRKDYDREVAKRKAAEESERVKAEVNRRIAEREKKRREQQGVVEDEEVRSTPAEPGVRGAARGVGEGGRAGVVIPVQQLQDMNTLISQLLERVASLETQLTGVKGERATDKAILLDKIGRVESEMRDQVRAKLSEDIEQSTESLRGEMRKQQQEMEERMDEMASRMARQSGSMDQVAKEFRELQTVVDNYGASLRGMHEKQEARMQELAQLEENMVRENEGMKGAVEDAERKLMEQEGRIDNLFNKVEEQSAAARENEKQMREQRAKIDGAYTEVQQYAARLDGVEDAQEALAARIDTVATEATAAAAQTARDLHEVLTKDLASIREHIRSTEARAMTLEVQLQTCNDEVRSTNESSAAKDMELRRLVEEMISSASANLKQHLGCHIEVARQDVMSLQRQGAEYAEKLKALDQARKDLDQKIADVDNQRRSAEVVLKERVERDSQASAHQYQRIRSSVQEMETKYSAGFHALRIELENDYQKRDPVWRSKVDHMVDLAGGIEVDLQVSKSQLQDIEANQEMLKTRVDEVMKRIDKELPNSIWTDKKRTPMEEVLSRLDKIEKRLADTYGDMTETERSHLSPQHQRSIEPQTPKNAAHLLGMSQEYSSYRSTSFRSQQNVEPFSISGRPAFGSPSGSKAPRPEDPVALARPSDPISNIKTHVDAVYNLVDSATSEQLSSAVTQLANALLAAFQDKMRGPSSYGIKFIKTSQPYHVWDVLEEFSKHAEKTQVARLVTDVNSRPRAVSTPKKGNEKEKDFKFIAFVFEALRSRCLETVMMTWNSKELLQKYYEPFSLLQRDEDRHELCAALARLSHHSFQHLPQAP